MPLPALLGALAPAAIGAAGSALGGYLGRGRRTSAVPGVAPGIGEGAMEVPGAGTLLRSPRFTGPQQEALQGLLQQGLAGVKLSLQLPKDLLQWVHNVLAHSLSY
jgi:hypothetical protein